VRLPDGVRLHVIEEGEGVPVVLLNGGPGNSLHSFVPHFSRAATFAHLVYYDPRGVGLSDRESGGGYSSAQAIADLEALREALGIEDWVVLGWSWGGHLARLYAVCHPERVRGLVLMSAAAEFDRRLREPRPELLTVSERKRIRACYTYEGRPVLPVYTAGLPPEQVQRMVYNAYRNGDWKRQHYYRPSDEEIAQIARYGWDHDEGYNRLMRLSGDVDLKGAFVGAPFPTLVVDGRWDMTYPADKPFLLAAEMPCALLEVFEEASHHVFSEQPEAFFALLEAFVEDAPAPDPRAVQVYREHVAPWRERILP